MCPNVRYLKMLKKNVFIIVEMFSLFTAGQTGWMDGRLDGTDWMDRWTDGWMDGWMDR